MYARFQEELDSLWDAYTMHQDTECEKIVNGTLSSQICYSTIRMIAMFIIHVSIWEKDEG